MLEKKPKFAVIFAAGFAEVGADGEAQQARLERGRARAATRTCSDRTPTSTRSRRSATTSPGKRIALITQSGHQGRPIFQAQELGIALSHWAPTGNEVDLEFADFARYFADQPDVGVIAAYIEGFKDGRTLMLAADHAAQQGVPIVFVKVGRTDAGAVDGEEPHRPPHRLRRGDVARCSASSASTRVDGLDELQDTAAMLARAAPPTGDGVCIYAISGGTGAHMADLVAAAGLRLPDLTLETQTRAARVDPDVPAGVEPRRQRRRTVGRRARPQDPRHDRRRPQRRRDHLPDHRRARVDVEAARARSRRRRGDDRQADLRRSGVHR